MITYEVHNISENEGFIQFALKDSEGNNKYILTRGAAGMLKANFTVSDGEGNVLATFVSKRSMLEKIRMPFVKIKCADGKKFTAHKDMENLYYMVVLKGQQLALEGDVYSEEYQIAHIDKFICEVHPDPDITTVEVDENESDLAAIAYFAVSVAR